MALTTAQLQSLRAAVLATPSLAQAIQTGDDYAIAAWCNAPTDPDFYAWRTVMRTAEVGVLVSYVAIASMTTANLDRLRTFYSLNPDSFDPSRADIRQFMSDTFSGALGGAGQATRDALDAAYRIKLTNAEKALASGTGSFASPATVGWSGQIDASTASLLR